jgi:hypothetical protein
MSAEVTDDELVTADDDLPAYSGESSDSEDDDFAPPHNRVDRQISSVYFEARFVLSELARLAPSRTTVLTLLAAYILCQAATNYIGLA